MGHGSGPLAETTAKSYTDIQSEEAELSPNTLIECTHNDLLNISLIVTKQLNRNTETLIDINNVKQLITEQKIDGKRICNMSRHTFIDIANKYNVLPEKSSEIFNHIIHYFEYIQMQLHHESPQHSVSDNKDDVKDIFTEYDLDEMQNAMERYRMSWMQIANCVEHEMYPKIANIMRHFIEDDNIEIGLYDLGTKHIKKMIDILKTKRNLPVEEREYLRKLCARAVQFVPITDNRNRKKQGIVAIDAELQLEKQGLDSTLLQDIFDVHGHFLFSTYHFVEYTMGQYQDDIIKASNDSSDSKLSEMTKRLKDAPIKQQFNFYPSYIIYDDLFEIFNYVFGVSRYVHYIRNNMKHRINEVFSLKLVIIPKSVRSVYNDNIVFPFDIEYVGDYLRNKNVFDYQRLSKRIDSYLQNQYDVNLIESEDISKLLIIIDRRYSVDIMYVLSYNTAREFTELNENYFLGFDFNVIAMDNHSNKVTVYLRYGINEKSRFYPEMMLSIIARLFKKPSDISASDLLHKIYAHKYKHAFALDLEDPLFNTYYKMITGFTHISVNINRALLISEYSAAKEILFFIDLLQYEMRINALDTATIKEMADFIINEEYDSETIIDDIRATNCSNIRTIVSKYSETAECNKPKTCTMDNIFELERCGQISYLLKALITLTDYGLDEKYRNIENMPRTKREWKRILNERLDEIYEKDLKNFIENEGYILNKCMELMNVDFNWMKRYASLIPILEWFYEKEGVSTNDTVKSIKAVLNWTKGSYINKNNFVKCKALKEIVMKTCPLCHKLRGDNVMKHIIFNCDKSNIRINNKESIKEIRELMESIQCKIEDLKDKEFKISEIAKNK